MNTITSLTSSQLRKAAALKDQLDSLQGELDQLLGSSSNGPAPVSAPRRKMSAAARAKIAAAQRLRWAKFHGTKIAPAVGKKSKRHMSAAARAKIAAAARARWAKAKAAGRKSL